MFIPKSNSYPFLNTDYLYLFFDNFEKLIRKFLLSYLIAEQIKEITLNQKITNFSLLYFFNLIVYLNDKDS